MEARSATRLLSEHLWKMWLGAAGILVVIYLTGPESWATFLYPSFSIATTLITAAAVALRRPSPRRHWLMLIAWLACWAAADLTYAFSWGASLMPPVPTVLYFTGYAFALAFGLALVRLEQGRHSRAFLDTAIVALSVALLVWNTAFHPQNGASRTFEVWEAFLYPGLDIFILGFVVAAVLGKRVVSRTYQLLLAAMALLVAVDIVFYWNKLSESYSAGVPIDAGWLISYALMGAAVLHPSLGQVGSGPLRRQETRVLRGIVFGVAVVLPPASLVFADRVDRISTAIVATGIAFLLTRRLRSETRGKAEALQEAAAAYDSLSAVEAETRLLAERSNAILDSAAQGILYLDADGWITFANPAAARLLGWPIDDLTGAHHSLFHGCGARDERCSLTRPPTDFDSANSSIEDFVKRDGVSFRSEFVVSPAGSSGDIVVVFSDVTERELMEQRLHQSEKLAALGGLAGGVAHDFNNLLAVIINYAEFLRENPYYDDAVRDIEEIVRAAQSAAALTKQLLVFSRRDVATPEHLYLNDQLVASQKLIERTIGEDIGIDFRTESDLPCVFIDPVQFEQVILNLAVNARDAMPRGGRLTFETAVKTIGSETVGGATDLDPGAYVMVSVSDTGTGIPRSVIPHIFEPFFTTKEIGKGTGLGLATSYGVISQAGGTIAVYSEEGVGTTFRIYLPVTSEPQDVSTRDEDPRTSGTACHKIMVVEDQASIRNVIIRVLKSHGHEVVAAAASGEEAYELYGAVDDIDLLVTDVVLPGISGPELSNELSRIRNGFKTLYMSGYSREIASGRGLLEPGADVLEKPFSPKALLGKIDEVLHKQLTSPAN